MNNNDTTEDSPGPALEHCEGNLMGFSDGVRVPAVQFDHEEIARRFGEESDSGDEEDREPCPNCHKAGKEVLAWFCKFLGAGNPSPKDIGVRFLLFVHESAHGGKPVGTQRALEEQLGIHESDLSRKIKEIRQLTSTIRK